MKKMLMAFLLLSIFTSFFMFGQEDEGIYFHFDQHKGSSTSHVAEVMEEAYFNGYLNNQTQFINRVTTTIEEELEDGSALLKTNYMTTQNSLLPGSTKLLTWGDENTVKIKRRSNGQLYDSENETLPTVRSVPSFPNRKVKVGESWLMRGEEVHDMRSLFSMDEIIHVPFTAEYTYLGPKTNEKGETFEVISVYYDFNQTNFNNRLYKTGIFYSIQGVAEQMIYWDKEKNDLAYYEENFQIELQDVYRNSYYFTGVSGGEVTEYHSVNTDENVLKVQEAVDEFNLEDVTVTKGDKGLTISLENIQFEPDSDILLESEKDKLRALSDVLKSFSNDLLITGHTAHRGTEGARQKLSEDRASSVATFLVNEGVRDKLHIYTEGKGSHNPIASNDTEEGRKKNRRVEITIMD